MSIRSKWSKQPILLGALILGAALLAGCGGVEDQPAPNDQQATEEIGTSEGALCAGTAYLVHCGANPYKVCFGRKYMCKTSCFPLSGSYYQQIYCL